LSFGRECGGGETKKKLFQKEEQLMGSKGGYYLTSQKD